MYSSLDKAFWVATEIRQRVWSKMNGEVGASAPETTGYDCNYEYGENLRIWTGEQRSDATQVSQTSRPLKQVLERRLPQNSLAQQSKEISTDIDSS